MGVGAGERDLTDTTFDRVELDLNALSTPVVRSTRGPLGAGSQVLTARSNCSADVSR